LQALVIDANEVDESNVPGSLVFLVQAWVLQQAIPAIAIILSVTVGVAQVNE